MTDPKVALCTTTIHEPKVLELLRAHGPEVAFFVAGDLKTPEQKCADIVNKCGPNAHYLSVETQKSLGYDCSELIGWNCIQRRNIAILEALKWGADILVLHDDDNYPMDESYFDDFVALLHHPFNGLKAVSPNGWFDGACSLMPGNTWHRGFPRGKRNCDGSLETVVGAKVGVAAGLCLGDPDIDATQRMELSPAIHVVSKLADAGIVVDASNYTVFNSQNTAILREFAPAMLLAPQFKRFDDILASLVTQRVMRERDYHVRVGRPCVWQARNAHNLLRDLEDELWGMQHIERFAQWLDDVQLDKNASVISSVMKIYDRSVEWMPAGVRELAAAWVRDCEKVMK